MPNLRFDHVHYRSSDFQKTLDFYVNIMEGTELKPEILLDKPNLHIELGGITLLFAKDATVPAPAPVPATDRLGVYHIAFLVENCDEATDYYRKKGATVAIEPFKASDDIKASFLAAPDGMWLELKEMLTTENPS